MTRHKSNVGLFLVAALLAYPVHCLAQSRIPSTLDQSLSLRIPEGRVDGTFVEALGQAARAFGVPMGISWIKTASSQKKRSIEYKNATVLEIIESIASSEPNYEVVVSDDVVHVATKEIALGQNFLHLKIPEFSAKGIANEAKVGLWMQLNQRISPDPRRGYYGSILSSTSETELDLTFTNATVEEILDSIAVASEYKVWLVTFEDNLNPTPSGFRRSESFFSKTATPDEAQPEWDILPWSFWPLALIPRTANSNLGTRFSPSAVDLSSRRQSPEKRCQFNWQVLSECGNLAPPT